MIKPAKKWSNKGFTLIEMIVAIAIFTIVALVAIGALLKTIDANKKSQSLKTTITNLNFALDSISREMRVGSNYYCVPGSAQIYTSLSLPSPSVSNCPTLVSGLSPGWTIFFRSSKTDPPNVSTPTCHLIFAYRFANNTIEKAETRTCGDSIDTTIVGSQSFSPIVSPDIIFTIAQAKVTVASNIQSYAQFHFKGYTGKDLKEKSKAYFDVQTTVSQRIPD